MADTAYERFLKDVKDDKAIEVEVRDPKPLDLDQIKLKIQEELSTQTEPKKPVKWLAMPDPKNIMSLYYQLNPTKRLSDSLFMDPKLKEISPDIKQVVKSLPDAKAPSFRINNREITQERDYTTGLDEIAKGIDSGIHDLQHSLGALLFAGTDLAANTDFLSKFEKIMEKSEPTRPETWRGELTSILTQFGIPGMTIAKITGRIPAVVKMKKAADAVKGGKLKKVSQVASRVAEGATIVGATDFLASNPGRESIFVEPEDTKGLTGRKKAGAEFRNRIKYGVEGTLIGGGFPLVGKFTQLGFKYLGKPVMVNKYGVGVAQLGAKAIDNTVMKGAKLLLGNKYVAPLTRAGSETLQNAAKFTTAKIIAPMIISGMSGKIVRQLPPFEKWRLQSVTSPNKVNRNIKRIDNFLSWFRSYGKQPKDIEGISEQVQLYIKSRARKIDRTYEGLENTAYKLAKQFENEYNKNTTSPAIQRYFADEIKEIAKNILEDVDRVVKGQLKINDLPKELQALTKDLSNDIKKIQFEFKKVLPKGSKADELAKDLATVEVENVGKYLVRSFQTFTNPERVPAKDIMDKAINYLVNNVIKKNKNLRESAVNTFPKLNAEKAYIESAKMHAEDILRTAKAEGKSPLTQLKEIGTRILQNDKFKFLKTGEELPNEIKNLLGPERNLKASVAFTTAEAIASMANKKAADYISKSGLKNGWLFNTLEDATNAGFIGAQQIKSVPKLGIMKSDLLGKWASPEYVEGFAGVGGTLDKLVQMAFYRHALQAKVGVQIGKTLYSPQTQVRNVTSASFFALMNGHVGGRASVTDAMRIVARDIFKAGGNRIDEVDFNNYVEKLVRLGVWDENVVASEMKSVLTQIKDGSINTTDALFDRLMKMAPTDKVARLYAGGDNLWKGYGFEFGKSQLSMALKNLDEVKNWFKYMGKEFEPIDTITGVKKTFDDAIEEASAYLLRNTYPTYSKVPPVIQELRKLPLGNFISFPAEILRTGANIMSIGLKEAAHPTNRAIQQMGIRRLTGAFMTSYAIGKGFTEISQFLTNSTDSQWNAYKRSSAASWDANKNLLAVKGWKNGESAAINFSYFSPYDSLFEPFDAAIAQAQKQNLNPQETEQFVMNLMFGENGPVLSFLEPFVSEPLGFDRFIDVTTRNGKKDGGGSVYTQSDDLGDKFIKSLTYVLDGVKPGVVTSGQKIGDALSKDLTKGGKPINLSDELLALFTGTRIIRIDVKKDLKYFTSTMNRMLRAVDETEGFYDVKDFANKTPTQTVAKFNQMQQEAFRIQKDMYIRIKDLRLLDLSENKIYDIMKQAGTSKKMINNLLSGRFTPVNYSTPRFETKVRTVKDQMNKLNQEDGKYIYTTNRNFLFPQSKLDSIIDKYSGVKFFPEIYNEETQKLEGGYNPDNESYQTDKEGRLMYDDNGKPLKEEGFIQRNIKKIPGAIKDLVIPGSPGFTSKPEAPPLGNTPTPKVMKTAANINPTTNLTQTESALLSPEEQIIRQRLRT